MHAEVRHADTQGTSEDIQRNRFSAGRSRGGSVGYIYAFDDLTEIRRLEREVRTRDRLSAVGRMAAGIAHEIRNPLTSIAGSVQDARHACPP